MPRVLWWRLDRYGQVQIKLQYNKIEHNKTRQNNFLSRQNAVILSNIYQFIDLYFGERGVNLINYWNLAKLNTYLAANSAEGRYPGIDC